MQDRNEIRVVYRHPHCSPTHPARGSHLVVNSNSSGVGLFSSIFSGILRRSHYFLIREKKTGEPPAPSPFLLHRPGGVDGLDRLIYFFS